MHTNRDRERELSKLNHAAASAKQLAQEEEQRLARAARAGDGAAFEALVRSHLRLAFAIASEYGRFGAAPHDLVSEAMLGLVTATRRFDPERGTRLAVYAAYWIRALLRRFTLANRRMVRAPSTRNGRRLLAQLGAAERELAQTHSASPDCDALAERLGVTRQEVEEVQQALRGRDAAVSCGEWALGHVEPASPAPSPEVELADAERQREMQERLARALVRLPAREREIVRARHLDAEPRTLEQLGVGYGVSRERVRQLEQRGYGRLRQALLEANA